MFCRIYIRLQIAINLRENILNMMDNLQTSCTVLRPGGDINPTCLVYSC